MLGLINGDGKGECSAHHITRHIHICDGCTAVKRMLRNAGLVLGGRQADCGELKSGTDSRTFRVVPIACGRIPWQQQCTLRMDVSVFRALGRIYAGMLRKGDSPEITPKRVF